MSIWSEIHNDGPYWDEDKPKKPKKEKMAPEWWLVVVMSAIVLGFLVWGCINAYYNPPEVRAVPIGSPG